jgi:hypothetical protein
MPIAHLPIITRSGARPGCQHADRILSGVCRRRCYRPAQHFWLDRSYDAYCIRSLIFLAGLCSRSPSFLSRMGMVS